MLPHPPVSPDLNPIEHVWDMLGRRLRRYNPRPTTLRQVEVALQQIWRRLPQRLIRRCINMRQRLRAVIQNRGENGSSQRQVAREMGVNQSVISRAHSRFQQTGLFGRQRGQGRRRETTARDDRRIVAACCFYADRQKSA